MIFDSLAIQVEKLEYNLAHLMFNNQGSVNVLNQQCLKQLEEALDVIAEHEFKGLIISSMKPSFIVGADITEFLDLFSASESKLTTWVEEAQAVFNKLENLPMPTIAAVQGFALGGGCETILSCDLRMGDTTAVIGLPETKLGIIPGFGGTVRLPRIIGVDHALQWMISGQHHKAQQAFEVGALDAIVEPEQLLPQALLLLQDAVDKKIDWKKRRRLKKKPIPLNKIERKMAFTAAKAMTAKHFSSHYIAQHHLIESLTESVIAEQDEAMQIELESFTKLAKTQEARSLIQIFLHDQAIKSKVKQQSKTGTLPKSVAVLGAGIMGTGIATQCALRDVPVLIKDVSNSALDKSMAVTDKFLFKELNKQKISMPDLLQKSRLIERSVNNASLNNQPFIIEAVVEHPKIKAELLKDLESLVTPETIIASNTSTIPITTLAKNLKNPERFCGLHFFNPVPKMPLVEVIYGPSTSDETLASAFALAKKLGKVPIKVQDCAGFFVNRVLFPYFHGVCQLIQDGANFIEIDHVMEQIFGWPMGPAFLLDTIGLDTAVNAQEIMQQAYPGRMEMRLNNPMQLLFDQGRLGQKTGFGFYKYTQNKKGHSIKESDPSILTLFEEHYGSPRNFSREDIVARCMLPMLLEVLRCLDEGIIDSEAEADMALVYGLGFPSFRGGPVQYIKEMNAKKFTSLLQKFETLSSTYMAPQNLQDILSRLFKKKN
jgi:3-hydroxyacyl-CoA dehydrogenase/enoyl-CoA hydratase/3-hydroxybutyryl-CoA epimerase/enoyl-CoA isomerase